MNFIKISRLYLLIAFLITQITGNALAEQHGLNSAQIKKIQFLSKALINTRAQEDKRINRETQETRKLIKEMSQSIEQLKKEQINIKSQNKLNSIKIKNRKDQWKTKQSNILAKLGKAKNHLTITPIKNQPNNTRSDNKRRQLTIKHLDNIKSSVSSLSSNDPQYLDKLNRISKQLNLKKRDNSKIRLPPTFRVPDKNLPKSRSRRNINNQSVLRNNNQHIKLAND
jgi:hypothetical protein